MTLPVPAPGAQPAWHLYAVRSGHAVAIAQRDIGDRAYYRTPVHRQPAMATYGAQAELPATDELAATHLAIPMSPVLDRARADEVVAAVSCRAGIVVRLAIPGRIPAEDGYALFAAA